MSAYAEYVALIEEDLLKTDANKNTYISRAEFENFHATLNSKYSYFLEILEQIIEQKTGQKIIYSEDAEIDPNLRTKELAKKFFDTLDANGDGYISFQEIRDAKSS